MCQILLRVMLLVLPLLLTGCAGQNDTTSSQTQNNNFDEIVSSLDTPQKLSDFMEKYFSYQERGGCRAYTPQQFFELQEGDCKDYAAFSSLVLSKHGYDAEMLCFNLYDEEGVKSSGHAVTVFKVDDSLKYISLCTIRPASSIQDVLEKEKARLDYARIGNYELHPPGSTYVCPEYKPPGR